MIKNKSICEAILNFPNYLYREGVAESTISAYQTDMECFKNFIKVELNSKIRQVHKITKVEIEQYKDFLYNKVKSGEFKMATASRKFNALRTFFRFISSCYAVDNILLNDKWGNKKNTIRCAEDSMYEFLEKEEIQIILEKIESSNDKNKYRDYAIIKLLSSIGCRRSELLSLKWSDVNFLKREIRLTREKTKNIDYLKISKEVVDSLSKLSRVYHDFDGYVFKSRQTEKLSTSAFTSAIDKWTAKAELDKSFKVTAHTFRHSFITMCIRENVNDNLIIRYTGHSSADSLAPYKHLSTNDMDVIASVMSSSNIA